MHGTTRKKLPVVSTMPLLIDEYSDPPFLRANASLATSRGLGWELE
jgi:hypothetical protein